MIDARSFTDMTYEIEKRMDYVIENWEHDPQVTTQEIRFVLSAYMHDLYKNKKIRNLAKDYFQEIKGRRRLDSETILTAITSALIINEDFSEYWDKLKNRIERSSTTEKSNLIIQFLTILNTNNLKKIDNVKYIREWLENLRKQDTEKELVYHWACKHLFSEEREIDIDPNTLKNLKEYLLWELIASKEYENQKEELRNKFIPELLNYKIDRIDWIAFLIYQFLKKYKPVTLTEIELNKKIKESVKSKINKKVWFPVGSSILFLTLNLWKVNIITFEILRQLALLIIGIILLVFEESLPTASIKKRKITTDLPATILIIGALLWIFKISWMFNLIISIIGGVIIWLFTE